MIALVRKLIADEQATGYTNGGNLEEPEGTQELLNYLDRAVDEWSRENMKRRNPLFMAELIAADGERLPTDFMAFCGAVPFLIERGRVHFYGPHTANMPVMYWARLPYVTDFDDEQQLPYAHDDYMKIAGLAAVYALNKHEFTVAQDMHLLGLTAEAVS